MNILVFDVETVPDVEAARRLGEFDGIDDDGVVKALFLERQQEAGTTFLKHPMHQVVAISCVYLNTQEDQLHVWSLGNEADDESVLIQNFFDGLKKKQPTLVSWNGQGFDLPVLSYRAMKHKLSIPDFWRQDGEYKWDNYLNRFHERHTDLMDVLGFYTGRANAPLDQVASIMGFPGKMGMDGSKVWQAYQDGKLSAIRDYCETDVLNTYLVYLRYALMRGALSAEQYEDEELRLKVWLEGQTAAHFHEFLAHWQEGGLGG